MLWNRSNNEEQPTGFLLLLMTPLGLKQATLCNISIHYFDISNCYSSFCFSKKSTNLALKLTSPKNSTAIHPKFGPEILPSCYRAAAASATSASRAPRVVGSKPQRGKTQRCTSKATFRGRGNRQEINGGFLGTVSSSSCVFFLTVHIFTHDYIYKYLYINTCMFVCLYVSAWCMTYLCKYI